MEVSRSVVTDNLYSFLKSSLHCISNSNKVNMLMIRWELTGFDLTPRTLSEREGHGHLARVLEGVGWTHLSAFCRTCKHTAGEKMNSRKRKCVWECVYVSQWPECFPCFSCPSLCKFDCSMFYLCARRISKDWLGGNYGTWKYFLWTLTSFFVVVVCVVCKTFKGLFLHTKICLKGNFSSLVLPG